MFEAGVRRFRPVMLTSRSPFPLTETVGRGRWPRPLAVAEVSGYYGSLPESSRRLRPETRGPIPEAETVAEVSGCNGNLPESSRRLRPETRNPKPEFSGR